MPAKKKEKGDSDHPMQEQFDEALARGGIQEVSGISWNPYRVRPLRDEGDDEEFVAAAGTVPVMTSSRATGAAGTPASGGSGTGGTTGGSGATGGSGTGATAD